MNICKVLFSFCVVFGVVGVVDAAPPLVEVGFKDGIIDNFGPDQFHLTKVTPQDYLEDLPGDYRNAGSSELFEGSNLVKVANEPGFIPGGYVYRDISDGEVVLCSDFYYGSCSRTNQYTGTSIEHASHRSTSGEVFDYLAFSNKADRYIYIGKRARSCSSCAYTFIATNFRADDTPDLVVFNGQLYLFFSDINNRSRVAFASTQNGTQWSSVRYVRSDTTNKSPSAVSFNGQLYVAFKGKTKPYIYIRSSSDLINWTSYEVGGAKTESGPALTVALGKITLYFRGQNNRLYTNIKKYLDHNNYQWTGNTRVTVNGSDVSIYGRPTVASPESTGF